MDPTHRNDGMQILVVDDEPDIEPLFHQQFRKERRSGLVDFTFAFSAEEALSILDQDGTPDFVLILSDINMPGMNGLELLRILKARYPETRVFMITAYADEYNYRMASELGADDFIIKPIDFAVLKEKIDQARSTS